MKKYKLTLEVPEQLVDEIVSQMGCDTIEEAINFIKTTYKMALRAEHGEDKEIDELLKTIHFNYEMAEIDEKINIE